LLVRHGTLFRRAFNRAKVRKIYFNLSDNTAKDKRLEGDGENLDAVLPWIWSLPVKSSAGFIEKAYFG
jgi:hypothetical protein